VLLDGVVAKGQGRHRRAELQEAEDDEDGIQPVAQELRGAERKGPAGPAGWQHPSSPLPCAAVTPFAYPTQRHEDQTRCPGQNLEALPCSRR